MSDRQERSKTEGTTTKRWRRYGQDRVYVTGADGAGLGYLDLLTNQPHRVRLDRAEEFYAALTAWHTAHPSPPPTDEPEILPSLAPPQIPQPRAKPSPLPRVLANPTGPPPNSDPSPPTVTHRNPQPKPRGSNGIDLAANKPGQAAAAVAAAYRAEHPVATFFARLLGRKTDERAWRIGAAGEVETARRLKNLTAPGRGWYILHAVPIGTRGSDIDHVLIGPPGVFTINTKNHPDKLVWAGPTNITVNRHPTQYAQKARAEADRAGRLLTAATGHEIVVSPIISVVGGKAGGHHQPLGVTVVTAKQLPNWLKHQPVCLQPRTVAKLFEVARRSSVWQPS